MPLLPKDVRKVCGYGDASFPPDHPFTAMCDSHDDAYESALDGFPHRPLAEADKVFLRGCLGIAGKNPFLIAQAYLCYALITVFRLTFRQGL